MTGSKGGYHRGKQRAEKGTEKPAQIEQTKEGDAEREEGSQAETVFMTATHGH